MGKVLSSFNNGFPGNVSREPEALVMAFGNKDTNPIPFGALVMLASDGSGVVNFSGDATEAKVLGIAVRNPVKTPEVYGSNEAGYQPKELVDVLTWGSAVVKIKGGSPKPGNKVYWTPEGLTPTFESGACEIKNMVFRSARDFNNVAEVSITERIY